jgi:glutaredoxin
MGTKEYQSDKRAILYRMVLPDHTCPFGTAAGDLLRSSGYEVEDRPLTTRLDTEAFMAEQQVSTTPQIFIGGKRIGGYDDLRIFLQH